jgi:hypothetical protein
MGSGNTKIRGGYCLHARKTDLSEIAHAAPCARELFFLAVRRANFKDREQNGQLVRRGQWHTSYEEIQEALHWRIGFRKSTYTRSQIEAAMKMMRRGSMITTAKTTGGLLITVCNYDVYQDPKRYEDHDESHNEDHTKATTKTTPYKGRKNGKKVFGPNSDELRLAKLLFDLIRERKPDFKEPSLQTWALAVDRMIRLDKRNLERIEAVIRWCQADVIPRGPNRFCWANNVLCTEKLRKQFDQLELKMATASRGNGELDAPPADPEAVKRHEARKRELMGAGHAG